MFGVTGILIYAHLLIRQTFFRMQSVYLRFRIYNVRTRDQTEEKLADKAKTPHSSPSLIFYNDPPLNFQCFGLLL